MIVSSARSCRARSSEFVQALPLILASVLIVAGGPSLSATVAGPAEPASATYHYDGAFVARMSTRVGHGPRVAGSAIPWPVARSVAGAWTPAGLSLPVVAVEGGGLADDAVGVGESAYGSTPAGRPFTRHYGVETGPQRNIPGSVVDEAIDNYPGKVIEGGKTVHYDPNTNVTVVTGDGGSIVSVHKGPPPAGQR